MREARRPYRGLLQRLRPRSGDAGMSLIELMVSLVVFSIAATGLAAGFISAIKSSGNDRNRLAAANLAQREVEVVRNAFTSSESGPLTVIAAGSATNPNPLPGGTVGEPLVVDGRAYTVVRSLSWLTAESGASPCDGGSAVDHPRLALGVKVTWNGMGEIDPVEAHTVLTPPRGVLNADLSFVAVKVIDAQGEPNEGRKVELRVGTAGAVNVAYTEPDGCAVIGVTSTGEHTVTLDEPGYVDINGEQSTSKSVNINPSSFQRVDFSYDEAASLNVQLDVIAGHSVPAGLASVTLGSTGFNAGRVTFLASTAPTSTAITGLWPISSGYQIWPGSCLQSDPIAAGGSREAPVLVPGETMPAVTDVMVPPVTVNVWIGEEMLAGPGEPVVATPVSTDGCETSEASLALGTTDAAGQLMTSLPAGKWEIVATNHDDVDGHPWPTPNILPSETAQTVEVFAP